MMQLCAKVGGEPWAIDELPFFYQCSMAVGYFIDDKQIALVGSMNQKATRYWSKGLPLEFDRDDYESDECRSQQIAIKLSSLFYECLLAFKMRINCFPKHVFLFTNKVKGSALSLSGDLDAQEKSERERNL